MLGHIQLAHVELFTPKPEESLTFFQDLLGMQVSDQAGDSVYLRAYEERYHHSLKLTASDQNGLGHVGLRLRSDDELTRVGASLSEEGEGEWSDGDVGHGPALVVITPSGHRFELFHDVEYHACGDGDHSVVLNRPQRRPLQGVPVRRIDHVSMTAVDVPQLRGWLEKRLDLELRERFVDDDGRELGAWLTASSLMHDVSMTHDVSGIPGRLHHVAFWYGAPQHLWDIADHLADHQVLVEHGPGKHGVTQAMFLYVIEPGGNRIELFGDSGQLVFDPTWQPVTWAANAPFRSNWIGNAPPATFLRYAMPPAPEEPVPSPADRAFPVWIW